MQNSPDALIHFISQQHLLMVEQLHALCDINSGSENRAGLNKMLNALYDLFKPIADDIQIQTLPSFSNIDMNGQERVQKTGDALFIRKRPHLKKRILLGGHMDTVFSEHHPFQTASYINDNVLNAPGASDMKGGLIVILHALTAYEQFYNNDEFGWDVFINPDEEIGSPASSPILAELAHNYPVALVYEPSMTPTGTLAKNRKGSGKLTIVAKGKAAHAGRAFDEGVNAIYHLSQAIVQIHELNGKKDGVTINTGLISGGNALNIVPDTAVAKLDIRINHANDEHWVYDNINRILQALNTKHPTLELHGCFSRPVKKVNQATSKLFHRLQKIMTKQGITIDWKDSGGCCDGNNLAQYGMGVLDTLGVRGGSIHSSEEYILLDSLTERAKLSALLLADFAEHGLDDIVSKASSLSQHELKDN